MPIPGGVVRVALNFKFPATPWPDEGATNTFHMQSQGGGALPVPDAQWIADQIGTKLGAHWTAVNSIYPTNVECTSVKTYVLGTDGKTVAEGQHAFSDGFLTGSGTSGLLPPEVAVALSLYNYTPGGFAPQKGRRRGRMFLGPVTQGFCTSDGKVDSTKAGTLLSGWQTVMNDFNTIQSASGATNPMGVVILSKAASAVFGVYHLAIDDHFDAMRSRQHSSPSTRQVVDLTVW